ncbi:MAG: hypothetical protein E7180_06660 [Erysipelotrichaceae bacterium]|nr:hypothetical protein [Erysipelotrichaceae bacterium]
MANFKAGDIAWIVESTIFVKEVEIVNIRGGFVTLRFKGSSGGMRVRESRLYKTKEEAEKVANSNKRSE